MIKAALDLVPRLSGHVQMFGRPYAVQRERVAYVPQRESIDWDFPVSVLDVVCMGLYHTLGMLRPVNRRIRRTGARRARGESDSRTSPGARSRNSPAVSSNVRLSRQGISSRRRIFISWMSRSQGVDASTEQTIVTLLRTLQTRGRTTVVVHHDLQTASDYFDHVLLLNTRVVAFGPTREDVFTPENIEATYGGTLTLLDHASKALAGHARGVGR